MAANVESSKGRASAAGGASEPPDNVVAAVLAPKHPPPETTAAASTRRWVVFSFWAIVLFLGLPIWYKTTSIYRATLPLEDMHAWASGQNCQPVYPLRIAIEASSIPAQDAQDLVRTAQHSIDELSELSAHNLRLELVDSAASIGAGDYGSGNGTYSGGLNEDTALWVRLLPAEAGSTPRAELQTYRAALDIFYAPGEILSTAATLSPLSTFIATEVQSLFREEQATLTHALSANPAAQDIQARVLSPEKEAALARQTTRAMKYAPTYHLTFSLFTPTASPSGWDIQAALKTQLEPLLEALSDVSAFTVDTQVQLYATFSPNIQPPTYDESQKAWTLRKDDLSGFINAAEWPLSPSIGSGPTVNFILYVPSPSQSPLLVQENGGNSWLIPQWGGVVILNPTTNLSSPDTLSAEALRPALSTFSTQLLSLLGVPPSPASLPLRLATLTRLRTTTLLASASSTLGALARLTQQLSQIAVPDTVAASVHTTLSRLESACAALRAGRWKEALRHARVAEQEAEKAFFDRSMVGMVYFPDEHKVAVYLPLLGPVAVPLVLSGIKEVKALKEWLRRRRG